MLKTTLAAISLITISAPAPACEGEAQVIGKIAMVSRSCEVILKDITFFAANQNCPLLIEEVQSAVIETKNCALQQGQEISGVIVRLDSKLVLE